MQKHFESRKSIATLGADFKTEGQEYFIILINRCSNVFRLSFCVCMKIQIVVQVTIGKYDFEIWKLVKEIAHCAMISMYSLQSGIYIPLGSRRQLLPDRFQ